MLRAILFDLDETLIDRSASIARFSSRILDDFNARLNPIEASAIAAAILAADQHGYRPREEVFAEIIRVLPWRTPPQIGELQTYWRATFPDCSVPRVGVDATLADLRSQGIRLGIVTNGMMAVQSAKIDCLKLRSFMSSIVISDAIKIKKPDPRIFQHALKEVGCENGETWFVGDHPENDILGAGGAGLRPVWVKNVHDWPAAHPAPELQIDEIGEILGLVRTERAR